MTEESGSLTPQVLRPDTKRLRKEACSNRPVRTGRERRGTVSQSGQSAMNVALSPDELARACADAMWKEDDASKGLGMEIVEIKPGQATLTMTVTAAHGQRPAHRPWRLHLPAGGFDLRLCLQLPQRARRRRAMRHHLHPAGQARRPAGRDARGKSRAAAGPGSTTSASPPAMS